MRFLIHIFLITTLIPGQFLPGQEQPAEIGIDEKPGDTIPLDLFFNTETGDSVTLRQLSDRAMILSLVYYRCPGVCPCMLGEMAEMLRHLSLNPDRDYRVLTISFDDTDTPAASPDKKRNYFHAIGRPFP